MAVGGAGDGDVFEVPLAVTYASPQHHRTGGAELERDVAFWVFIDALDEYVESIDPNQLSTFDDDVQAELAHVLPSLSALAAGRAVAPQHERYRSHRAMRALLEQLAHTRPLVLVLDDFHWADSASVELLGALLRRPPAGAVLTALALRPRQTPERLAAALERAHRARTLTQIALEAFTTAVKLKPKHAEAWNNLGVLYADRDEPDKAERHYRSAAEAEHPDACVNLANMLTARGEADNAEHYYRRAADCGAPRGMGGLAMLLSSETKRGRPVHHSRKLLSRDDLKLRELLVLIGATRPDKIEVRKALRDWFDRSWFLDEAQDSDVKAEAGLKPPPTTWRLGSRPNLKQMHWDIAKLLELGVDEKFLMESNITPEQARDLVKGLLYLKERFDKNKES